MDNKHASTFSKYSSQEKASYHVLWEDPVLCFLASSSGMVAAKAFIAVETTVMFLQKTGTTCPTKILNLQNNTNRLVSFVVVRVPRRRGAAARLKVYFLGLK